MSGKLPSPAGRPDGRIAVSGSAPMRVLALFAPLSFLLALVLGGSEFVAPATAAHVAFVIGIVPLVFGAMLQFVPVLTRSGDPHAFLRAMPFVAQAAGLLAVLALHGAVPRWMLHLSAVLDILAAATLIAWMILRSRRCLGMPHPGWRWYGASLAMLLIALLVVPAMDTVHAVDARRLHMHLNTLGFVGLAAFGTLPVLLPTALGRADPQAGAWLRLWWPIMTGGALLLGVGAAVHPHMAAAGAVILLAGVHSLLRRWRQTFTLTTLWRDGAAVALTGAGFGYGLLLIFGLLHGFGVIAARPAIAAFACLFLLPLVTGALTQLLPVWRHPGEHRPERDLLRARLAWGGQVRALCFLAGGLAFVADWQATGFSFAVAGLLLFAFGLLRPTR